MDSGSKSALPGQFYKTNEEEVIMKLKFGIKEVVAIGIGTALFVALTQIQIPTPIPNTYLQPRMAVMAFLAAVFGPVVGGVIGLLGHALGDAMFYGSVWWSWVFPDGVVGFAIGLLQPGMRLRKADLPAKSQSCCLMWFR